MAKQTKTCPQCRRQVPSLARLCRHCEHGFSVQDFLSCPSCTTRVRRKARVCRFCQRALTPNREEELSNWLELAANPGVNIEALVSATDDLLRMCTLVDLRESLEDRLSTNLKEMAERVLKSLAGQVAKNRYRAMQMRWTPEKIRLAHLLQIYGLNVRSFNQAVRVQLDLLIQQGLQECFNRAWVRRDLDSIERRRQFVRELKSCRWSQIAHRFAPADQLLEKICAGKTEDWQMTFSAEMQELGLTVDVVQQALDSLEALRKREDEQRIRKIQSAASKLHHNLTVSDIRELAEAGISLYEVQTFVHQERVSKKWAVPAHLNCISHQNGSVVSSQPLPFEAAWDGEGYTTYWDDPDDPTIRWNGYIRCPALVQLVKRSGEIEVLTGGILPRNRDGTEQDSERVQKVWKRIQLWQKWRMTLADEIAQLWRLKSACQSVIQICVYPTRAIRAIPVPDALPGHNIWGLLPQPGYLEETAQTISSIIEKVAGSDFLRLPDSRAEVEYVVLYLAFCANTWKNGHASRPTFRSGDKLSIEIRNRNTGSIIFSDKDAWDLKLALRHAREQQVDLSEADLRGANLQRAELFSLRLRAADLSGAALSGAKLVGVDLSSANLSGADLAQAGLTKVDLSHSNLAGANLCQSKLREINLQNANIQDGQMRQCKLDRKTSCLHTNFAGTDLGQSVFEHVDCREADFSNTNLCQTNFKWANCEGANFSNASMTQTAFDYCRLSGASFNQSLKFSQVTAKNADLTGTGLTASADHFLET